MLLSSNCVRSCSLHLPVSYFQEQLLKETWEVIYQEHDNNEIFNNFLRIYLKIVEASFPVIYHDKHKDNAWITKGHQNMSTEKKFVSSQ